MGARADRARRPRLRREKRERVEYRQYPGEGWAGWSCPEQEVLVPSGLRELQGTEKVCMEGCLGRSPVVKWVIDLVDSTDVLVRSGSGAGSPAPRQVEP